MRAVLLPLTIVMLPQIALSALQLGVPVLAPAFVAEAGLAPEAVGLISGCIGFGSVWMFAANAAVTPVLGPLRALMAACLLSVAGAILVLSSAVTAILIGAVLIGFAYAVTAPAGSQILSAHVPARMWGTVFSIRQAGVPLGGVIAGLAGTGLAVSLGWRAGLLGLMAVPLLCTVLLLAAPASFHTRPEGIRFRVRELFRPSLFASPFRTLGAMPQLRPITAASLGFAAVQGSMFSFFTTFATDGLGLGLALAGALFATMQAVSFGGRLVVGLIADLVGAFPPVLSAMSLAGAGACVLMAFVEGGWPEPVLFAIAALTGLAAATWNGLFLAEVARLVPKDMVSQATAGATFFTFVAYMLTPPAFALAVHLAGYRVAFILTGCIALFGFACLRLARGSRAAPSRREPR